MLTCEYRNIVQMLMSVIDPDGVKRRMQNRLVRRVYQNKVIIIYVCVYESYSNTVSRRTVNIHIKAQTNDRCQYQLIAWFELYTAYKFLRDTFFAD